MPKPEEILALLPLVAAARRFRPGPPPIEVRDFASLARAAASGTPVKLPPEWAALAERAAEDAPEKP